MLPFIDYQCECVLCVEQCCMGQLALVYFSLYMMLSNIISILIELCVPHPHVHVSTEEHATCMCVNLAHPRNGPTIVVLSPDGHKLQNRLPFLEYHTPRATPLPSVNTAHTMTKFQRNVDLLQKPEGCNGMGRLTSSYIAHM